MSEKIKVNPIRVTEARERLPQVIAKLEKIQELMREYSEREKAFESTDFTGHSKIRYQLDVMEEEIYNLQKEILQLDCVIKDFQTGLLDFVAIRDDEYVWLCYKLGEDGLNYYHGWDAGFIGRLPIDFE